MALHSFDVGERSMLAARSALRSVVELSQEHRIREIALGALLGASVDFTRMVAEKDKASRGAPKEGPADA